MTITEFLLARIAEAEGVGLGEFVAQQLAVLTPIPDGKHDNTRALQERANGYPILRELAAIYRDHPDYRPEWKC